MYTAEGSLRTSDTDPDAPAAPRCIACDTRARIDVLHAILESAVIRCLPQVDTKSTGQTSSVPCFPRSRLCFYFIFFFLTFQFFLFLLFFFLQWACAVPLIFASAYCLSIVTKGAHFASAQNLRSMRSRRRQTTAAVVFFFFAFYFLLALHRYT